MNLVTANESTALAVSEKELMQVLRNSLYPGAADESIKMVIGYCKASGLDVMQKPVHIVPMWDSKSKVMRDVIMPGIGSYRTQAARSGCYAGISEPEFGPDITERIGDMQMTYPAWCRVIVKRLLPNGMIAEFLAKERWIENYATKGKDSSSPNAMWQKRPYAQLAKCTEAQALRKAFPAEVGSQATADEMQGKSIDEMTMTVDNETGEILNVKPKLKDISLPHYSDEQMEKNLPEWQKIIDKGTTTAIDLIAKITSKYVLRPDQYQRIASLKRQETTIELTPEAKSFISEMDGGKS